MLYMIFQYGSKPVLIQRILIGFKSLLEIFICLCRIPGMFIGIGQWPINWCTSIMMIHNYDDYPFCRLQLLVETFGHSTKWTNQNSLKSPKFLSLWIRKRYYKTFWTSVINSPMSPPSPQKKVGGVSKIMIDPAVCEILDIFKHTDTQPAP